MFLLLASLLGGGGGSDLDHGPFSRDSEGPFLGAFWKLIFPSMTAGSPGPDAATLMVPTPLPSRDDGFPES